MHHLYSLLRRQATDLLEFHLGVVYSKERVSHIKNRGQVASGKTYQGLDLKHGLTFGSVTKGFVLSLKPGIPYSIDRTIEFCSIISHEERIWAKISDLKGII